jgi:DNA-binding winged helix-turn-helix (wHTH) protein
MGESGPSAIFGLMHRPQAAGLAQFHSEPRPDLTGAVQRPDAEKPFFAKRTTPPRAAPTEVSFGPFRLLPTLFLLLEGDKPVPLGSRALEILIVLLERRGELVSKQELMARVWPNVFVEPANLTVHVSALRRVLRDGRDGNRFIINIPGRGYRFVASAAFLGRLEPGEIENRAALPAQS